MGPHNSNTCCSSANYILLLVECSAYVCKVHFNYGVLQVHYYLIFLMNRTSGCSSHCWKMVYLSFLLYYVTISFLSSLQFTLYIQVLWCWVHMYLLLLYISGELTLLSLYKSLYNFIFVSCDSFCLNVYFVWCNHSLFSLFTIYMWYLFFSFYFQPMCDT